MAKTTGLSNKLYVGISTSFFNVSGDVGAADSIQGGPRLLDVTAIQSSAMERLGGVRDGSLNYSCFFNPAVGAGHAFWSTLPTVDVVGMYVWSGTVGDPVACIIGKQANYPATRGTDGSMLFKADILGNGDGLYWCQLLKALGTDASATNGTSIDFGAVSTLFGATVFVGVNSVATGTMVPEIQDSADNVSFAAITGMTLTGTAAAAQSFQRVSSATGQTIRRYVRIASTGTFTSANFVAAFIRHITSTL